MSKKSFWDRQPRLSCPDCSKSYKALKPFFDHLTIVHGYPVEKTSDIINGLLEKAIGEVKT